MKFSIVQIKSPALRRSLLVVAFPFLAILALIAGAVAGAIEWIGDFIGAYRNAWRGRDRK